MFHDYMMKFPASEFHNKLKELFLVLDTRPEDRYKYDKYMDDALAAFPYVNGSLFSGDIEIPRINDEIRTLILERASNNFDWSPISPTIFGAVFESTLNPETRREGGMHYTSIENIHKVIDPLFLNDLKKEIDSIKSLSVAKTRRERAIVFQNKLASIKIFDPACGSGNFLTESYSCLRRIENEAIGMIYGVHRSMGDIDNPIKVSINQFYGIEINDFACSVAKTALWIAEAQMMQETDDIVAFDLDPLPLKTNTNIHEGNALRINWDEIIPASQLDYIIGNPPFIGAHNMSSEQKKDISNLFGAQWKNKGNLDYVTGWFKKAAEQMAINPKIRASLVSTNSVCQGEQVANLWKPLIESGVHIDFAYRTFAWSNEARKRSHVHCVIIGFSTGLYLKKRIIYDGNNKIETSNINGYLIDGTNIFVESRNQAICNVPTIGIGNKPIDNGFYLFKDKEKEDFVKKEPEAEKYFKQWYGADEFINRRPRWCLWLGDADPTELVKLPQCLKRINSVKEFRLSSKSDSTIKLANRPTHFHVENIPTTNYLLIPRISSEKRQYIPIGFMSSASLSSDAVHIIRNATLYHFGILTSSVHNAWTRIICGRLESRLRYSKEIVYNNFPWPNITDKQHKKIEQTAKMILDARKLYPKATYAQLYGNLVLFSELAKAHKANDDAVMEAFGFDKKLNESQIVARLLQLYKKLANN